MLLTVDIGNIHIAWGLFEGDRLVHSWHSTTGREVTRDEFWLLLGRFFRAGRVDAASCRDAAIASVVPPLTGAVEEAVQRFLGCRPLVVGPGTPTGMPVHFEAPGEVAPDRIANGVAAFSLYGGPVVVVDFGTATVFDVVSARGEYLGGAVAPGITSSAEALYRRAAKLRAVELFPPARALGRNTADCLRSGLILGWAGMADAMVDRIRAELGQPARAVLTGEFAHLVWGVSRTCCAYRPFLTLEGLRLIHRFNRPGAEP